MSQQPTPGPWEVTHQNGDPEENYRGVRRPAQTNSLGKTYHTYVAQYCSPNDARLIAAAPDLLAALKALRNECSGTPRVNMLLQLLAQADTALVKAEGRT